MKSIPAKKLIAVLKANGFVLVRQKGSHMTLMASWYPCLSAEQTTSSPVPQAFFFLF